MFELKLVGFKSTSLKNEHSTQDSKPRGNRYTRFSCANILNNFHNDSDHPSTSRCSSSHVHMSSSKKSKLKQPEEALTTEETPIEVKVSPWPRRRRIVCHFFLCNAKSFGIWVLITFLSCLVYASIVYGSLVNRDIFRRSKNTIPGYHHPLQYNITLRFAANYHDAHNLSFSGQTQLLFEPTVLTPNFVMNIGPNVKINQIYFQRTPDGTFLRATKTGHDNKAQTISYVISFMFEPGRRYLAVIDYSGQLYPPANQRETPRLVLFKQNKKHSYAIVHINPSDSTEGLRFVTPSLDYDTFTARFALNIERHTGYSAISNMPIEQSIYHISDKLGEDMFPPTIPIRPSQLAFVVSNLNSTTVFVCGTPEPPPMPLRVNFVSSEVKDVGRFFGSLTDRLGSSDAMGFPKLDGVILPKVESTDQPGISVINDHDARESAALALDGRYRTQC